MVTDANGNRRAVSFSPLGLVAATAVMGKKGEQLGDTLDAPGSRLEYDFFAFVNRRQPVFVRSIVREHHVTEPDVPLPDRDATIEHVEYSDGFGRLLQTRTQAEDVLFGDPAFGGGVLSTDQSSGTGDAAGRQRAPGDPPNVIVSGTQVYDNKGRVVEKYEPFFSTGFEYVAPRNVQSGQKATMFFDPRGHVIRTVNPDGSEQRVIYGIPVDLANPAVFEPTPWEAYTYDTNDLAPVSNGPDGASLADAAPAAHYFTPFSIVIDALGRTVESIARNGADPTEWLRTRSTHDIRDNILSVTDALNRVAFRYTYDFANRPWRIESIDAGVRRVAVNVVGHQTERRDSKGALILQAFDRLQRPIRLWARDDAVGGLTLRQRMEYGDAGTPDQPALERATMRVRNLLGQLVRHHDEAGLTTVAAVDFKGNVLDKSRRVIGDAPILEVFAQAPANGWRVTPFQVDWDPRPGRTLGGREGELLDATVYQTTSSVDALNRITRLQFPKDVEGKHRELRPGYNNAGGLDRVFLDDTLYVERIAYDAKGQRALIAYGNGVMTRYGYDPHTFRLKRLRSEPYSKPDDLSYHPAGEVLQDFGYDYDLAGNIVGIRDRTPGSGIPQNPDAATTTDPVLAQLLAAGDALNRRFDYDPIYRLLAATGRECDRPADADPFQDRPRCTDVTKTRAYVEQYRYDAMGNVRCLKHCNKAGGVTRHFTVETTNNRLRRMQIGQTGYDYDVDASGNMRSETTSRRFDWNHSDQMKAFRTQIDGAEPSIHAHYLYDAAGQRVKKVVRTQGGQVEVTHYIDGAFEHHRWGSGAQAGENNHVHVTDDKQRIAVVRLGTAHPDDRGPAIQLQLGDHLSSSNVVVDSDGALINREEFTAYGETSFGSFAKKRYRFTGMERDEESGLNYHWARYYAPWLCRWSACDPAAPLGGQNQYSYSHNNALRLTDTRGTSPDDPTAPLSLEGVGVTISANGVTGGSLSPMATPLCDEMNPQCNRRQSADASEKTGPPGPAAWLKTSTRGPNSGVVWRITSIDPDPLSLGMAPENPGATYSPGQHVLNEQGGNGGSQYISASRKSGGATNIEGDPYAISVPRATEAGVRFHSTEDIIRDLERLTLENPGRYPAERWEPTWKRAQNPGGMEGGEVLFEPGEAGIIPPDAIETPWMRNMRWGGRAFLALGVAMTAWSLGNAFKETVETGDVRPLAREVVRQAAIWTCTLALGVEGAGLGAAIGSVFGPGGTIVGGFVGGLIGSAVGAIAGTIVGDWLSGLF